MGSNTKLTVTLDVISLVLLFLGIFYFKTEWIPTLSGAYLATRVACQMFEIETFKSKLTTSLGEGDILKGKLTETSTELESLVESSAFLKTSLDELIDLQTIPVACPCGKNSFDTPVFINTENTFVCDVCRSKFKVTLEPDTVIMTESTNILNIFDSLKQKAQSQE
jgi:hypothetical protein